MSASGEVGDSSRHHSDFRGFFSFLGFVNLRLQISWGIVVHSGTGFRLGTSLVTNLKKIKRFVIIGFKYFQFFARINKHRQFVINDYKSSILVIN